MNVVCYIVCMCWPIIIIVVARTVFSKFSVIAWRMYSSLLPRALPDLSPFSVQHLKVKGGPGDEARCIV